MHATRVPADAKSRLSLHTARLFGLFTETEQRDGIQRYIPRLSARQSSHHLLAALQTILVMN
jgi:hypothetical protein